jgi:hypothetical protein
MHETNPPVLGELHDKLLASFEMDEAAEAAHVRRSRRRAALGAGVFAVVASVALLLIAASGPEKGPLSVSEATASVAAATLNASQPATDAYVYERTVARSVQSYWDQKLGVFSAINESTDDEWSNPFRCSFTSAVQSRSLGYPSARDKSRAHQWMREMRKKYGSSGASPVLLQSATGYVLTFPRQESLRGPVEIGGERLTSEQLKHYPTTPEAIRDRIEKSVRNPRSSLATDTRVWNALAWAPSNYGPGRRLPPALRAGLVRALGEIPGVAVVPGRTAASGANAITFVREAAGIRHELTLDRSSGVTLASTDTIVGPQTGKMAGWPNGTVFRSRTVLERKVVDRVPRSIIRRVKNQPGVPPPRSCT